MSYLVFLNGDQVEIYPTTSFAQVKQVNDIANLTTRNSNYMPQVKIEKTANNVRIVEGVSLVGNQSMLPYRLLSCDVIDTDTGEHIIYQGTAVLIDSNEKDYVFTFYDGVVDFYRLIENKKMTELGLSELNHVKNLANIAETWSNLALPYRYILADYNGNNVAGPNINIDFQVPSASIPYLWQKLFDYIGWTFSGSVFQHEKFKNDWLSYPKPVSLEEPILVPITTQETVIQTNQVQYPYGDGIGGVFYGSVSNAVFFPNVNAFNNTYYNASTGSLVQGLFRLNFEAQTITYNNGVNINTTGVITIQVFNTNTNQFVSSNNLDITNGNYIDLQLNVGDKILVTAQPAQSTPYSTTTMTITGGENTINLITGFTLGFDQAFIDMKVTDFVKDIMVRYGLTPFKDKYRKHIKFLTLYELFQNPDVDDWSDKFVAKINEKPKFGNYAKRNYFRYKYNDDEMKHNDGYLSIDNDTLPEDTTLMSSIFYSPERLQSPFLGGSNTYKIWEKQIKDDETVEYKDLDGRFYLLRAEKVNSTIVLGSNILGGTLSVNTYYRESYFRMTFNEILFDWYAPITSIFNKAKLIPADFWLNAIDVANIDFSKLKYIRQLGGYFLLNKVNGFTNSKPTRVELIEVDYFTPTDVVNPTNPDYTVEIGTPTLTGCSVSLPVNTDYDQPVPVIVNVFKGEFNVVSNLVFTQVNLATPITGFLVGGVVSFDVSMLPYNALGYKFGITIVSGSSYLTFENSLSPTIVLDGSCYVAPVYPSTLAITGVTVVGPDPNAFLPNTFIYQIAYAHTGIPSGINYLLKVEGFGGFAGGWFSIGEFIKTEGSPTDLVQNCSGWSITKIRISIMAVTSAEHVL